MDADRHPHEREERRDHPHRAFQALAWVVAVLAVCAGVGWLYLLRDSAALAAGPRLHAALPLEELASRDAQPLLRVAVAWLPAGFVVGLALGLTWRRPHAGWIAVACGALTFAILFLTTAASEAVSQNERLTAYLGPALHRSGLWGAVAFAVIGSLPAAAAARRRRPRRRAEASTRADALASQAP
jgi:hypothetical protein